MRRKHILKSSERIVEVQTEVSVSEQFRLYTYLHVYTLMHVCIKFTCVFMSVGVSVPMF